MKINHEAIKKCNVPTLEKIIKTIVRQVNPDKIILFGSYARGDNHAKSDIDLLIVKKKFEKGREEIGNIERALYKQNIDTDLSLIPIDFDRYYELKEVVGYMYHNIHREGKVLYETL